MKLKIRMIVLLTVGLFPLIGFSSKGKTIYDDIMQIHLESKTSYAFLSRLSDSALSADRAWIKNQIGLMPELKNVAPLRVNIEKSTIVVRGKTETIQIKLVAKEKFLFSLNNAKIYLGASLLPSEKALKIKEILDKPSPAKSVGIWNYLFVENANAEVNVTTDMDIYTLAITSMLVRGNLDLTAINIEGGHAGNLLHWASSSNSGCNGEFVASYLKKIKEYGVNKINCGSEAKTIKLTKMNPETKQAEELNFNMSEKQSLTVTRGDVSQIYTQSVVPKGSSSPAQRDLMPWVISGVEMTNDQKIQGEDYAALTAHAKQFDLCNVCREGIKSLQSKAAKGSGKSTD
jgi:hypothetical protein